MYAIVVFCPPFALFRALFVAILLLFCPNSPLFRSVQADENAKKLLAEKDTRSQAKKTVVFLRVHLYSTLEIKQTSTIEAPAEIRLLGTPKIACDFQPLILLGSSRQICSSNCAASTSYLPTSTRFAFPTPKQISRSTKLSARSTHQPSAS